MRYWPMVLAVCLFALFRLPAAVAQQAPAVVDVRATQATISADPAAAQTASGLPQQQPPPRTLRAHWHVFAAFAFAWGLLFAYALVLGRRFSGLESQIRRLEGTES